MAIDVMNRVWKQSKQKGSELLLLLGIADHCDDDGVCWPSIKKLAEKSRMSERQTQRNIDSLVETGELYVEKTVGRHNSNRYFVMTGFSDSEIHLILKKRFKLPENGILKVLSKKGDKLTPFSKMGKEDKKDDNLTPFPEKGDISEQEKVSFSAEKGVIAMSPESSWNPHEKEPSWEEGEVSLSLDSRPPFAAPLISSSPKEEEPKLTLDEMQTEPKTEPISKQQNFQKRDELVEEFCVLLRLRLSLYPGGRNRLVKEIHPFIQAEITAQEVRKFSVYWYTADFRGQKNEPPTLKQVSQLWETAMAWQVPTSINTQEAATGLTIIRPAFQQVQPNQRITNTQQNLQSVALAFDEIDRLRAKNKEGEING